MPTDREVELYYFDLWEVCQMLGRPHPQTVTDLIKAGKVEAVKHHQKWMIAPDQIGVLRGLVSYSSFMQTNNDKESQKKPRKKWFIMKLYETHYLSR